MNKFILHWHITGVDIVDVGEGTRIREMAGIVDTTNFFIPG